MGGGALPPTTSYNLPTLPPSSSNSRVSVSGNYNASLGRHCADCSFLGGVCRCEYKGERANGSFINRVFGPIPSTFEVQNAIAALHRWVKIITSVHLQIQIMVCWTENFPCSWDWWNSFLPSFLHEISSSGLESDQRIVMETQSYSRVYEAFRLLQTDSSVQVSFQYFVGDRYMFDKMTQKRNNNLLS